MPFIIYTKHLLSPSLLQRTTAKIDMDLDQYILVNTSLLALIIIMTILYLIFKTYKSAQKRKIEKQHYTPLTILHIDRSPKTQSLRREESIPDLTDTDISSDEDAPPTLLEPYKM